MSVDFYYKGLSAAERTYPYKPKKSVELAKGTLYEAWFDTLQTSPWYLEICETKKFPSDSSKKTWEQFGDLRKLTFESWWLKTGHKIFSEVIPYRPIREVELDYTIKQSDEHNKPPTLVLEIPLNLSPSQLTRQFELLVAKQFDYLEEITRGTKPIKKILKADDEKNSMFAPSRTFNRWEHSTAEVHQQRDTKMTYQQIKIWLTIFKEWTAAKEANPKLTLSQYAQFLKLKPKGVRDLGKGVLLTKKDEDKYASALSEYLQMARFLMAHATEGVFPFTEPHPWATGPSRKPRKVSK